MSGDRVISETPTRSVRRVPGADGPGTLELLPSFLSEAVADEALTTLLADIPFEQKQIVMFGRRIDQPRLVAWMGDAEARYTYSGLSLSPEPWHPLVLALRDRVAVEAKAAFNSVLLNLYRSGGDSMGFHADDEPELGLNPTIASVSLGAMRTFVLRPRSAGPSDALRDPRRGAETIRFALNHGSLLIMGGSLQHHYRHGIPKEPRAGVGPRINLTFRNIHPR